MIIKKVNYEEILELQLFAKGQEKYASPRIIITAKKQPKVYPKPVTQQKYQETDSIHFNDSEYFHHQNRLLNMQGYSKIASPNKTYVHKIKNKMIEQPYQLHLDKKSQSFRSAPDHSLRPCSPPAKQDTFQAKQAETQFFPESNSSQGSNRNYTSLSMRKKMSAICSSYRTKQVQEMKINEQVLQEQDGKSDKDLVTLNIKLSKYNKSCCEINPYTKKEYLHRRISHDNGQKKLKKFNSLDYCIIKPNEIKAFPLTERIESRTAHTRRSSDEVGFYPDLIASVKQREELFKRELFLQVERQRRKREQRQMQLRSKIHTSYANHRPAALFEQKNEVLPWQVEGLSNLADII